MSAPVERAGTRIERPMNVRPDVRGTGKDVAQLPSSGSWTLRLPGVGSGWTGTGFGWAGDVGLAAALTAVATLVRLVIDTVTPGVVPFILVYPAIAAAVLIAGPRAGLITLIGTQLLAWYAVVPVQGSFRIASRADGLGLLLSTLTQLMLLGVLAAYHSAARTSVRRTEGQYEDARLALRELDHRTRNNLQLMQSILYLKAQRTIEPEAKRELVAAGVRIGIVGSMNSFLVRSGVNLSHVALQPYLGTVCRHLKESLCPDGIGLEGAFAECEIDNDRALYLGLIVNELVTNAIKHAFPDGKGEIRVDLTCSPERLTLIVCDNGRGKEATADDTQTGLGTRLLHMMVGRIRGTMEELPGPGTGYRIEISA